MTMLAQSYLSAGRRTRSQLGTLVFEEIAFVVRILFAFVVVCFVSGIAISSSYSASVPSPGGQTAVAGSTVSDCASDGTSVPPTLIAV